LLVWRWQEDQKQWKDQRRRRLEGSNGEIEAERIDFLLQKINDIYIKSVGYNSDTINQLYKIQ